MYCSKCGAKLSDDAKFCSNCGAAIDENNNQENFSESEKKTKEEYTSTSNENHTSTSTQDNFDSNKSNAKSSNRRQKIQCPKCGSTNVQYWATKKGASFGKGCCGYIACGPLGLLFSLCGANRTEGYWVCKDCGYEFTQSKVVRAAENVVQGTKDVIQESKEDKEKEEKTKYETAKSNIAEAEKLLVEYGSKENLQRQYDELQEKKKFHDSEAKRLTKEIREKSSGLSVLNVIKYILWVIAGILVLAAIFSLFDGDFGIMFVCVLIAAILFFGGFFLYRYFEEKADADTTAARDQHNAQYNQLADEQKEIQKKIDLIQNIDENRKIVDSYERKH